ncbi:MAG: hypothetical protein SNH13_01495 [Rikenellaceae bacterium]
MMIKPILASLLTLCVTGAMSQNKATVTIQPTVQHVASGEGVFNRDKHVRFHDTSNVNDPELKVVKEMYNFRPDYAIGRAFYYPLSKLQKGEPPKDIKNKYQGVREVSDFVATGHQGNIFWDKEEDYSKKKMSKQIKKVADYVAESYAKEWDSVPLYLEPFNEPMVHAVSLYPEGRKGQYIDEKLKVVMNYISEYHREVGRAVHNTPALKDMKVMGFASAYPELEANNFKVWNNIFKPFIDVAGEQMDILSIHLYDGVGINNNGGRRSGSNIDAIMDMIQTYSNIRLGEVRPMAITEYGRLVPNQPGFTPNGKVVNLEPITNSQAVCSQLHMVMNFMEYGDDVVMSIPFTTGKQSPYVQYVRAALWLKQPDGSWELTPRKYFFEMLKDLKGNRVVNSSSNIDIQTQAFVDGKQMYVVLNNLNDETQSVELSLPDGLPAIESVEVKSLKIHADKVPDFAVESLKAAPKSLDLIYGETVVLTYNFESAVEQQSKLVSSKLYSKDYFKPIVANTANSFTFSGVDKKAASAVLRVSVGRDHGKSLEPKITINGKAVDYSGDVIRGYDQTNRKRFFGTLTIPVAGDMVKSGDNVVSVSFPDAGGHVSSVVLQVNEEQ